MIISSPDNSNSAFGLFATPFLRTLAGHQQQILELRKFILSRETAEYAHKDSPQLFHEALFESRFDLFRWQDRPAQLIKARLLEHLMSYLKTVNSFEDEALKKLNFRIESWFHITRKGGYFRPHTHPLASVSLIYCVDPGDKDLTNNNESGQVVFTDPRHNASMYLDPANRHMQREYSFNSIRFRLKPDELCIFPSYLQHSVEPYRGEKPRITIAANFSFHLT